MEYDKRENCMQNNSNKKIFETLNSKTKIYLIIIALLLIFICVKDINAILPSCIGYVCILAYAYWTNSKKTSEISQHIQELTGNIDTMAKKTLINSPFPLVILETDGNVVWRSSKFITEFANIDIRNTLNDLLKQNTPLWFLPCLFITEVLAYFIFKMKRFYTFTPSKV